MRGKHGAAAAVRHEVQSRDEEIATYQAAVARLTRENRDLKAALRTAERTHSAAKREWLARVSEAAAPKVEAQELVIKARTDERDAARRELRSIKRTWERAFYRMGDHFRSEHGLRGKAIAEAVFGVLGNESAVSDLPPEQHLILLRDGSDVPIPEGGSTILVDEPHLLKRPVSDQVRGLLQTRRGER